MVGSQVCSFAIECMDSSCRKPPRVTFGKNDGKIYETSIDEGEGLCYTRHHAIICFCKSHLCNDEGFMEFLFYIV
ncbi:hypothetical protein OESDEN_03222 [Oesophagostomum dentatum]|uniref:Uncharacterized protein n=1 Tax=Oesophagostomum dentatum TaxID=61180 RepID=A0A0B1TN28_OESDE|nr:hypothetical protein OESDEN_03222 [Oesophagostomum dentatum]